MNEYFVYLKGQSERPAVVTAAKVDGDDMWLRFYDQQNQVVGQFSLSEVQGWNKRHRQS